MKNFSKLFLASLLAGSLIMTGCGGENPTSADVSGNGSTDNTADSSGDKTAKTYTISGKVTPTNGYIASNAKFVVTFKDSENNTKTSNGAVFNFTGLKTGTYVLTAEETATGKYKLQNPLNVNVTDSDQNDLAILMQFTGTLPTFTFSGVVVDNQNQGVKFAKITADNGVNTITSTTNPDNGNFTLEKLTPGEYSLTVEADSFAKATKKLFIDEEGKKITLDDLSITNLNLGNIKLLPNYASSGAIEGILTDPATGKAVAQGTKIYFYKRNNDPTIKPTLLTTLVTDNSTGYFSIDSLPADYYAASIGEVTAWDISYDKDNNPLSYNIPANQQCFTWLQVTDGTTSKVPGFSK